TGSGGQVGELGWAAAKSKLSSASARAIWTWALTGAWMASVGHPTGRAVPGLAQATRGTLVASLPTIGRGIGKHFLAGISSSSAPDPGNFADCISVRLVRFSFQDPP